MLHEDTISTANILFRDMNGQAVVASSGMIFVSGGKLYVCSGDAIELVTSA